MQNDMKEELFEIETGFFHLPSKEKPMKTKNQLTRNS
jgi:hypothetical protein